MNIAILFSTVEGHTGKICRFVETMLGQDGHAVRVFDTDATVPVDLNDGDAVILLAPVHERRHPDLFEATVAALAEKLAPMPTLMLSVSLSASFQDGREEAQDYLDEFKMRTGLAPTREALVAGAVKTERYDYFAAQVVKMVVLRGKTYDAANGSHEFTDWDALRNAVTEFTGIAASAPA
ncbi:menaquinone-dependent protoporphyrinogen oxidase [Palleronia marisminoris]|uniref:Protoporphyrinogen IX dehydrogenase [menaquinone] n=1 Tax=Palleronia marisminoris TaxID=315423 RepID=A0A1Y5RP64_9RHOB|nr:flavodoxin domain-containing protein [Palleronia marisminoris]SFG24907.1 menaquinone-dependent protoporphyrinogen oxidase [Palleronia marisminoris]SLN19403.1 Protoporphyrinogen IX dehydrogenase [menaquinone] [Palleronia marisminoris]